MFCWPSRRNTSNSKKSKSSDFSSTGDDDSVTGRLGSGGILAKPYKSRKKGKKSSTTFKCDLSEALLPPSEECLLSLRSASCNSSIRDLSSYHQRGGSNKHFVSSSQHIPNYTKTGRDADSVSINNNDNNNRSAEVLLFYSNNSLSTRNSLADFIENEEFNYKSLWGKDISEWDARESQCNTLERDSRANAEGNYYVKTGAATIGKKNSDNKKSATVIVASEAIIGTNESNPKDRLTSATSSPSLTIPISNCNKSKTLTASNFDDDEPLPSPPPTPPEAKISLSLNSSSLGSCAYFKYPPSSAEQEEKSSKEPSPFRIHSSTSTSSLTASCILTPDIVDKPPLSFGALDDKSKVSDCGTQTLPFWQLEFPGILHCSCSNSSEDSGIVLHNSGIGGQLEDSTSSSSGVVDAPTPSSSIVCVRGHESPGGDSSSGISSSDDNLECLQADEEIMLKSLKNSLFHQTLPFQLCRFGSVCSSNNRSSSSNCTCCKEKPRGGDSVITSIANINATVHSIINNEFANSVVTNSSLIEKQKVQEHNYKNQQQAQKEKCELSVQEAISSVTNHQDRNRLGPVGKNYGSPALDANANESDSSLLRDHDQTNGELEKSCTKTPASCDGGVAEPTNKAITKKPANSRVSATNQQNTQNSLLIQENSSLKEEVSRLTNVVSDLQQQISQLASSGEETRKNLEDRLTQADMSCVALAIVSQQCDNERIRVYEQLVEQQTENKDWKLRLDEKLAELQKLQEEYEEERELHQEELRTLASNHEIEVDVTVRNCENKLGQMQKRHDETLAELKRSHTDELERLQESQRQELEQTIQKHRELLDQHRNQSPHDILHKEVESLQVVMEMRNEEIRVLRKDLMDYKNTLNDLQMAREHGKSLLAKIEDLEAQLEKARSDKRSLQERYQALDAAFQQQEADNNRLARCNEELNWKMKSYDLVEN